MTTKTQRRHEVTTLTQMTNVEVQNLLDLLDSNLEAQAEMMTTTPRDTTAFQAMQEGRYDMMRFRRQLDRELRVRGL